MTNNQLLSFFQLQRQIFGVCPNSGQIFRLSDCDIYLHKKSEPDWFQKIELAQQRINNAAIKFNDIESLEEDKKGRLKASLAVKKFDKVFKPTGLNPDDSMGVFHPIDYVAFNGMKAGEIKNVILLDSNKKTTEEKRLQKSIDKVIEKENYEWMTFRVEDNGNIVQV
jgi:predicted Holliday junction resolvase-like endonuclease